MRHEAPTHHIEPTPVASTATEQPIFDLTNDRQRDVLQKLEAGFEQVATNVGFQRWLQTMRTFHHYSFSNTILIMVQRPDATHVMGYGDKDGRTGWKSVGRQVRKGETGIRIFAPNKRWMTEEDPQTGQERRQQIVTSFRIVSVFDVSQTDGEPLLEQPDPPEPEESNDISRDVNRRLSRWLIDEGVTLESRSMEGTKSGYYSPRDKRIAIRSPFVNGVDPDTGETKVLQLVDPLNITKTNTLIHEAAHYVGAHDGTMDRGLAELIAEGATYVVAHKHEIPRSEYSFTYTASWARGDRAILQQGLGEIHRISNVLINAIAGVDDPSSEDPGAIPDAVPHASG
jgi:antirestriction protein ArdC